MGILMMGIATMDVGLAGAGPPNNWTHPAEQRVIKIHAVDLPHIPWVILYCRSIDIRHFYPCERVMCWRGAIPLG